MMTVNFRLLLLPLALLCAGLAPGCGLAPGETARADDPLLSRGPYPSVLDKAVHTGELEALMAQYNRSLFELEHPRVKVAFINFDMWSPNFKSVLAVSLSSGRAPAVYIAHDLPQTIEQGLFAD